MNTIAPTPVSYSFYVKFLCVGWILYTLFILSAFLYWVFTGLDSIRFDPVPGFPAFLSPYLYGLLVLIMVLKAYLSVAILRGEAWAVSVGYYDAWITLAYFTGLFFWQFITRIPYFNLPYSRSLRFDFLFYLPYFLNVRKVFLGSIKL